MKQLRILTIATVLFLLFGFFAVKPATAASLAATANMNWNEAACQGTMNGAALYEYGVQSGDDLSLTINNQSSVTMSVDVNNPFQNFSISAGGSHILSLSNMQNQATFVTGTYSGTGCSSASDASFFIYALTGSISCISEGPDHQGLDYSVTGHGDDLASVFDGSTLLQTLNNSNSSIYVMSNVTTTKTFQLRAGKTASARLLDQTTCSPPTSASSSSNSSASKTSINKSATSSPTSSKTQPTDQAASSSPNQASVKPTSSVVDASAQATNKKSSSHTVWIVSGLIVAGIAATGLYFAKSRLIKPKRNKKGKRK